MPLRDCFLLDTKLYLVKPYATFGRSSPSTVHSEYFVLLFYSGSCSDLLCIHQFGIREQLIAHIIWQVVQALRYLHDRHIMHR